MYYSDMNRIWWKHIVLEEAAAHTARTCRSSRNPMPMHGHDFAEIFWIESGKGKHLVNGTSVPLHTGDMVFVRPHDCHGIETGAGGELLLVNVAFGLASYRAFETRFPAQTCTCFAPEQPIPAVHHLSDRALAVVTEQFEQLARVASDVFHLERFVLNVFFEIAAATSGSAPSSAPEWLSRACREIREPDNLVRGVQGFFALAGRSPEHVARVTKKCLGVTPVTYVNTLRIEHAARRLIVSHHPISRVALDAGFENMSHFYRFFKRHHGMTPRGYRQRYRNVIV